MTSLPCISAIFRPGLHSLSCCTEDSSAASSCRMAPTSNSLWAQEAKAARFQDGVVTGDWGQGGWKEEALGTARGALLCHPSSGDWGVPSG